MGLAKIYSRRWNLNFLTNQLVILQLSTSAKSTQLRVHCQKGDGYVTNIMSCFRTPTEVDDPQTRQINYWESYIFEYPEAILIQNKTNHSFDNLNNWRYHPISHANGWHTCWWSNHQFSILILPQYHWDKRIQFNSPSPQDACWTKTEVLQESCQLYDGKQQELSRKCIS